MSHQAAVTRGDTLASAINTELMAELITTITRSKYQLLTVFVEINRSKNMGSIGSGSDILFRGVLCVINALAWARSATIYSFFASFFVSCFQSNHEGELGRADIWSFRRLFPPRPRVRKIFSFLCPFSNNYIYIFSKDPVLRFFSFIFLSNHRGNWGEIIVLSKIIRP